MVGLIISGLAIIAWAAYEIYIAPTTDNRGYIVKDGKKLSDLFKKKK